MNLAHAPMSDKADSVPNCLLFGLVSAEIAPFERRPPKKC